MSSYVCSPYHYKKVRDLTIRFLLNTKSLLLDNGWFSIPKEEEIIEYTTIKIKDLIQNNIASVNLYYNDNIDYEEYNRIINWSYDYNSKLLKLEELISLYYGYKCIDYQIDIKYNRKFINMIKNGLACKIVEYITNESDKYMIHGFNQWEFIDNGKE